MRVLWNTGVRISEAIAISQKDIDFQNDTILIKWLKNRKYNYRTIPIHPQLRDILRFYVAPLKAEDKLFPISRVRGWQLCRKYLNGHPHQLRHSFAVNWLRCGGDVILLHRMLGHKNVQATMEYLKIVPVDIGKELLKINFN